MGSENIAPKSVAREMLERFCSFHDYVRDYGLQRVEGILLRYLSEAYRGLAQSVPARYRSPEVEEVTLTLASLVRGVDASLLEEWEALRDPVARPARGRGPAADATGGTPRAAARPICCAIPRALAARVRTDLHRLLGALARKDYEDALLALRLPDADDDRRRPGPPSGWPPPWPPSTRSTAASSPRPPPATPATP